jgi:SNF2 family DNA or RNA helicase
MGNWRQEARKFAPDLKVLTLHGAKRKASFIDIPTADIVLTTYALLHFDAEQLLQQEYEFLILDEAQTIKNPRAKASQIVRQIDAQHRLCLTGTPMENHLTDLWSLFDFLQPGLLGKERHFLQQYRQPIERDGNEERALQLSQRIAPFILRRTKSLVASDLPPKTEIVRSIPLEQKQRDLYDSIRLTMHKQIRKAVEDQGFARSHIAVLDALLKLRQACCDPRLLDLDAAREVEDSAKFDALMQMLPELVEEGRRILVFSQFTSMLALIEQAVQALEIPCLKLTGQSQNRAEMVEKFQSGDIPVFLISLKAGGTGLNLTAADTVIHYDPWWNPAAENQATDRAYRIGQDKPVFVYKLITEGTVEEKILQLQHRKRELADGLYSAKAGSPTQLTQDDLNILLQPIDETPTDNTQSHD